MTEQALKEERKPAIDKLGRSYGTGRRKESTARVWVKKGHGKITVNGKDIETYFGRPVLRMVIGQVFEITKTKNEIDVECTVKGGGLSGQAGAILHGIARALDNFNPEFHSVLRKGGFLTRDSRTVERKKPGRPKARKSFQFSKR
jgi:small subunit ribosomal protein S9